MLTNKHFTTYVASLLGGSRHSRASAKVDCGEFALIHCRDVRVQTCRSRQGKHSFGHWDKYDISRERDRDNQDQCQTLLDTSFGTHKALPNYLALTTV